MREERERHRLDAILIPATAGEAKALSLLFFIWRCYAERNAGESSRLAVIITIASKHNNELHATITKLIKVYEVDKIFANVEIVFLGIPEDQDIYIRHDQDCHLEIPPYGLKSGPNIQFFESARLCSEANTVLLNESDMYPISPTWVRDITTITSQSEPFWVLGSVYRGSQKLGPDIASHINGNAFYATGHEDFARYLNDIWAPGVKNMCKTLPDTAYDIWFSRHYHASLNTRFDKISANEYSLLTEASLKQRTTMAIANLSIMTDKISVEKLVNLERSGCSLVHAKQALGPALAKSIKAVSQSRRNSISLAAFTRAYIDIQHSNLPTPYKQSLAEAIALMCRGDQQSASKVTEKLYNEEIGERNHSEISCQSKLAPSYYASSATLTIESLRSRDEQGLRPAIDSLYAFSPYRSGSTLLFNGLQLLCGDDFLCKKYISLCDASFAKTGDPQAWASEASSEDLLLSKGSIYGGFRDATMFTSEKSSSIRIRLFEELEKAGIVPGFAFLLRDPRDCIASLYHFRINKNMSGASSSPQAGYGEMNKDTVASPDEFALEAMHEVGCSIGGVIAVALEAKMRGLPVRTFAYEDALYRQHEMFAKMCGLFDFNLSNSLWHRLVALSRDPKTQSSTYLNYQSTEHQPGPHVRRATPGEHKDLFSPETNQTLSIYFAEILEALAWINPVYMYI